eukprot:15247430-Alexandrium_andersonii.AAC.1
MLMFGLPPALFNIIWWIGQLQTASDECNIDVVEWYSGVSNIQQACSDVGLVSMAFDVTNDPVNQNALSRE